jgi:hypothetical protein
MPMYIPPFTTLESLKFHFFKIVPIYLQFVLYPLPTFLGLFSYVTPIVSCSNILPLPMNHLQNTHENKLPIGSPHTKHNPHEVVQLVPFLKLTFYANTILPQCCHPLIWISMGLINVLFNNSILPTDRTFTITCILYMSSLHTIPQNIQTLSKQINFNMVLVATNIPIFTLLHKVRC